MSDVKVEKGGDQLNRGIQPWHVSLIALGGIIGSCYFLELGMTFHDMGPGAVILGYLIAGITIYGVMQAFAELLVNIPRRGSFVSYTREFMGDTASAGIGWAFWANWVCYVPSEAIATAIFTDALIPGDQGPVFKFVVGCIALGALTLINVFHVKFFGHIESIMAIIKIVAIIFFIICAILIFLGFLNNGGHVEGNGETFDIESGFIGLKAAFSEGMNDIGRQLFPEGGFIIITLMIWTLVNFQGSEIVGLSAAETQNPAKEVPKACKAVAYRIIAIYIIPIFMLCLIMPHYTATLEDSVFAQALSMYGIEWGGTIFTIVTLIAAFSCANSGFYGTVRAMYGLSVEGLAPKFLSKLNKHKTPQNATLFTLLFIWIVFLFSFFASTMGLFGGESGSLFTALIGISGFTGTLCWVGILYSQIKFRMKLKRRGYDPKEALGVKAAFYPVLGWFAIIVQIAAMVLLVFEAGDGIPIFVLSMTIIIVPIVIYQVQKYRGKIRNVLQIGEDETTMDEKYPPKPDSYEAKHPKVEQPKTGNPIVLVAFLIIITVVSVVLSIVTLQITPTELNEAYIDKDGFFAIFTDPQMTVPWVLLIADVVTYALIFIGVFNLHKYKHK